MSKVTEKKLTKAQLAELKQELQRRGLDRNKAAQFLTPKSQYLAYQQLVADGRKPDPSVDASASASVVPPPAPSKDEANGGKEHSLVVQQAFQLGLKLGKNPGRGPGRKPRRIPYSILLDPDLLEAYDKLSVEQERPVSELMRLALRRGLQTAEAK